MRFEPGDRVLIWVTSAEEAETCRESTTRLRFVKALQMFAHGATTLMVEWVTSGGFYMASSPNGDTYAVDPGWIVAAPPVEVTVPPSGLCSCPLDQLMRNGCRCGAVKPYDVDGWAR